uniref:Uncharacterized protein n=1 Tax=Timema shepardi TaxID=629360 RepID=A0A7R9G3L6_TIMSH|nr:unnamed protein product [Timema shepardi]
MKKSESTVKNVKVIRFQGPSRTGRDAAQLPANTRPTVASRTSGRCPPLNLTDSIYKGKHLGKIHTHLSKILNSFKLEKMMLATPWLLAVFLAVAALASPSPAINEIRQPSNKPGRFLSLPVPNKCAQRSRGSGGKWLASRTVYRAFSGSRASGGKCASRYGWPREQYSELSVAQEAVMVSGGPHEHYTKLSVAQEAVMIAEYGEIEVLISLG